MPSDAIASEAASADRPRCSAHAMLRVPTAKRTSCS
jgi:hypothetical protein